MSSIIDIARSGVMAYQTALSVTAENIANVNTEGYARRDVMLTPLAGGQMTPISAGTLGQGVRVEDVRRAFDAVASDRLRASNSAVAAAGAQVEAREALEQAFLPGAAGIGGAMEDFFATLGSLAAQPADIGLRRVVMTEGAAVAASVADAGAGLAALRDDVIHLANGAVATVNSALSGLARLNEQMLGLASTPGAANPLFDQRDRLLTDLAAELQVNVSLDQYGRADVKLGPGPGGTALLNLAGAATTQIGGTKPLSLMIDKAGTRTDSVVLTGGTLGGQAVALAAIDASVDELDGLARRLAADLNTAHRAGLDLNGIAGGELFTLEGVSVVPAVANRGSTAVTLSGTALNGPVQLTYDEGAALWRATDGTGTEIATGAGHIDLPGLSVTLSGAARGGDQFTLAPRSGNAIDMRFALTDPRSFAAAAANIVAPLAGNAGTARVTLEATELPATGLPALGTLLAPGGADAITMISPGVVGVIPAGTQSVDLLSLGRQAGLDWAISDAEIATGGTLSFGAGGAAQTFAFPAGMTASGLAAALNAGTVLSADGSSLAEVGVQAGGVAGQFTLALGSGEFSPGAQLVLGAGTRAAIVTASQPQASPLQVFTRDGRQVSGTPLTAAAAAALLTEANGFLPGAQYRPDYLNAATGAGYRGMEIDRQLVPGAEALTLSLPGVTAAGAPMPATALSVISGNQTVAVTVPEGSTAARAASLIRGAVPGLAAESQTALTIGAVSDGQISFTLAGQNLTPVPITATVAGGDLGALARAISAATSATGITASLSPDGTGLLLRHAGGEDIRLAGFTSSTNGTLTVTATDNVAVPCDAALVLGAAGRTGAQITGQVQLTGAEAFGVTVAGSYSGSIADPFAGRMATREIDAGGAVQTLTFGADPEADAGMVSGDGLQPLAASLRQTLSVNGTTVTMAGGATPQAVAEGLAALLRDGAPVAGITGAVVAAMPAEGAAMAVRVDGQTYALRMQGGAIVVEGPEAGRLSASFGPDNRLRLTVPGGAPDGLSIVPDQTSAGAAAFGLGAGQGAALRLTGVPVVPADVPPGGQTLSLDVAGVRHDLTVRSVGGTLTVDLPPGFAGTATVQPDNSIALDLAADLGPMRVLPGADVAGFAVPGVAVSVSAGALRLTSQDGTPPAIGLSVQATAQERLRLTNLPPEDLIVVMGGGGALRLAGEVTPATTQSVARASELRISDPASGLVELIDSATGQSLSSAYLDGQGQATLGGYRVTVSGQAVAGDRFGISANTAPNGDSRALEALIALAEADPTSGRGGFAKILSDMTVGIGSQVRAAQQKQGSLQAANEALSRKVADASGVNLDAEAAKLIELQQAYQASAQALSVARQLFDTILNAM